LGPIPRFSTFRHGARVRAKRAAREARNPEAAARDSAATRNGGAAGRGTSQQAARRRDRQDPPKGKTSLPVSDIHLSSPFPSTRPGYITANFSGPSKYRGTANSHFHSTGTLFTPAGKPVGTPVDKQTRWEVFVSDIGFFGAVAAIVAAGVKFGALNVLFYYFIPYLVVNSFLVLITYLQHTDVYIRHYRAKAFTWERGALSTVDRSYGWLVDSIFHHIADTHVVHHLFHTMPFYNAIEATKLIRSPDFLGPYYLRDDTPIPAALWRSWSLCRFVEDDGDIVFYKGAGELNEGLAAPAKATSGSKKRK
jgi:hypothetical protein